MADIYSLRVVGHDGHFKIQTGELAQVSAGIGILGPKHGTHLIDAAEIPDDRQLLVELGRLGQAGRLAEVVGGEHAGPALRLARDELGRVDLDEAPGVHGVPI